MLDFLRAICLCHDVTRVSNSGEASFLTGASQDELVHMEMVQQLGFVEFVDRNSADITLKVLGKTEVWANVKFYDFDTDRKMMTRVVRNKETGQIIAFTKGADSSIFPKSVTKLPSEAETSVVNSVDKFANKGLRTLVFAKRVLDPSLVTEPITQSDIEKSFSLLGASGVEDLLQEDVCRCLQDFKQAKMRTWMLTGDKGQTAKMIGIACGLLEPQDGKTNVVLFRIDEDNEKNKLDEMFEGIHKAAVAGADIELMISG